MSVDIRGPQEAQAELLRLGGQLSSVSTLLHYNPLFVSGFVLDESYARRAVTTQLPVAHDAEVDELVRFRRSFQRIVRESGARVILVTHVSALEIEFEDEPALMVNQLRELLRAINSWPNQKLTIRIVPKNEGLFPGIADPFDVFLLEPDDGVLIRETAFGTYFSYDQADIGWYASLFRTIQQIALAPRASQDRIRSLLQEREQS